MRPRKPLRDIRPEIKAFRKAIDIIGNQSAIARHFKIMPSCITHWLDYGLPAERVLEIERLAGGQVTRYELRPDIYPRD